MLTLCLLLASLPARAGQDQDQFGNEYPAECGREALANVYLRVFYRPASFFLRATRVEDRVGVLAPTGVAILRDDLVEGSERWLDVVRHETCHKVAGAWHG